MSMTWSLAERLIDLTEFKGYKGLADRKENRPIDRCLTQLNEYEGVNGVNRLATKLGRENMYILLDVLLCSIAEYFYELCRILASPKGESKYKQRVKILSDTTQQSLIRDLLSNS